MSTPKPKETQEKKEDTTDHGEGGPDNEDNYIRTELGEMNTIPSMCPKCEKTGTTRLMIMEIPHFKQIIVSSFECPFCGEANNDVSFGGVFGPKKVRYELQVRGSEDLDRQVVKSEFATISIPDIELEIPPESQKASLNTIEGILQQTRDGLQFQQPVRKIQHPELYTQIEQFCEKLEELQSGKKPFTFIMDDPAGNSYIEGRYSYYHPTTDNQLVKYETERTEIDRQKLGVAIDYNTQRDNETQKEVDEGHYSDIDHLPSVCPACAQAGVVLLHQCDIPYFKETIIMAFKCDHCGYKSNEIKTGGAISEKGLRLVLTVDDESDLKRDVLKSDTATLLVPEISLELAPGTLGGFFSTVEGTIAQVKEQLRNLPQASFATGDSAQESEKTLLQFVEEMDSLLSGKKPFTFILDDPLSNIYIQNPRAHLPPPDNEDPKLRREEYERTFEQDEELGLHDMNVGEGHAEESDDTEGGDGGADTEAKVEPEAS